MSMLDCLREPDDNRRMTLTMYCLGAAFFFLTVSTAMISILSVLVAVGWLITGQVRNVPRLLRSNPVALVCAAMFAALLLGVFYSSAPIGDALDIFKKYREFLVLIVVMSLLWHRPKARQACETSFIAGGILLLCLSYIIHLFLFNKAWVPDFLADFSTRFYWQYLSQSFMLAMLAYFALNRCLESSRHRRLYIGVFILTGINLFYITPGRTGMMVLMALILLALCLRLSMLHRVIGVTAMICFVALAYFSSSNFSQRVDLAVEQVASYEYGTSRTSLGLRFDWWTASLAMIAERPIIGHGTGSFRSKMHDFVQENRDVYPTQDDVDQIMTQNPHNEYLLITVQLGVLGLLLFITVLATQVLVALRLNRHDCIFALGAVTAIAVGCLANSLILDSPEAHIWAFLSGLYFAAWPRDAEAADEPARGEPESA